MAVMDALKDDMEQELVPFNKRKACIRYAQWIESAGAKVRGWNRETEEEKEEKKTQARKR